MKIFKYLKYLIYMILVCFLIFLDIYLEDYLEGLAPGYLISNKQGSDPLILSQYIIRVICYLGIAFILCFDQIINEYKKAGKWRVEFSKLIILGIPSLYFVSSYLFIDSRNRILENFFYIPHSFIIKNGNIVFMFIFIFLLGYSIFTSLKRVNEQEKTNVRRAWISKVILIVIIVTLLYFHVYVDMPYDKVDFFNYPLVYYFITPLFYIFNGILLGFDHFTNEINKKGKWRVRVSQILFMVIPALYFSFTIFLHNIYMPLTFVTDIIVNKTSGSLVFITAFQLVLGYGIITSFYKAFQADKIDSI